MSKYVCATYKPRTQALPTREKKKEEPGIQCFRMLGGGAYVRKSSD